MSLQARLRHPLGERWIDLPERGVDQPVVVGRAGGADVQVPSATVGLKHCVLFVHEGQWVLQDVAEGGAGTFVNGSRVNGAAYLRVGDVITLGPDATAPSIEIDPAAAAQGATGQPVVAFPVAAMGPNELNAADSAPMIAPSHSVSPPGAYSAGYAAPAPAAPAADGSIVDWAADTNPRYYTPRRPRRTSDGSSAVVIGVVLTLLITAGTGYWIYHQWQKATPRVRSVATATQPSATARSPVTDPDPPGALPSIFNPADPRAGAKASGSTRPTPRAAPAATPPAVGDAAATTVPPTGEAPMESGPDSGSVAAVPGADLSSQDVAAGASAPGDDAGWKQVEAARFFTDEAKAIIQFDDYARSNPGAASDKLRQYTDRMLDRIWFERIENLCEQREELARKVQEVDRDMAEETDAAHKTGVLVPLRQLYVSKIGNVEEELTHNMKYQAPTAPNLLDDAELERLRQGRDPQYYASWKGRVLAHIRRTHGELPWVTTKSR